MQAFLDLSEIALSETLRSAIYAGVAGVVGFAGFVVIGYVAMTLAKHEEEADERD